MAVSTKGDQLEYMTRMLRGMLQDKAVQQLVERAVVAKMDFKVDAVYDMNRMCTRVRMAWKDPNGDHRRYIEQLVDDHYTRAPQGVEQDLGMLVNSLDMRGELYFFKLHRHFPRHLEKVTCKKDGECVVRFKNGHELTTHESKLEDTHFLASCAMLYDLV
jgi:hypothetical protein